MRTPEFLAKFVPIDERRADALCSVCGASMGVLCNWSRRRFISAVVLLPVYSQREEGFYATSKRPPRRKRKLHHITLDIPPSAHHRRETAAIHVGEVVHENCRVKCATCGAINEVVLPN